MSRVRNLTVALAVAGAVTAAGTGPALAATTTTATRQSTRSATSTTAAGHIAQPNVIGLVGVVGALVKAYQAYSSYVQGQAVQTALQEIIQAIVGSEQQIISHIDAVAAADVKGCATDAVIEFADFNALTQDQKQNLAMNATACASRADSLETAVSDPASLDSLGFAVNTVGPIALMARVQAGLTDTALTPVLRDANTIIYDKLIPACEVVVEREPGAPPFKYQSCTAYNGDNAQGKGVAATRDAAAANISWLVAEQVLPTLT